MLNGQTITLEKEVQYKILKSLSKGEQTNIWEVKPLDNQQHYALKIINRYQFGHLEKTALLMAYAQAEIEFLSSLNDPAKHHIAPCLDAGLIDQMGYRVPSMVMPLALYQQDNLATLIKKNNTAKRLFTGKQWLTWFRQLLAVLHYLQQLSTQQKPLIHRNIQPKHCLLDANQHLFLTDFGLIQKAHDNVKNIFLDNVDYCAPEQLFTESNPQLTQAADTYAAAMVLYELIVGKTEAQHALNNLTIEHQFGEVGGLTAQETTDLQTQLEHLFRVASDSSETVVASSSQQLTQLLQTMLAPLPQDRPSVTNIMQQLETVIAALYPDMQRTKKAKAKRPKAKAKPKKKAIKQPIHHKPQATTEPKEVPAEQPTQPVVTINTEEKAHYFSGQLDIYSHSPIEINLIGNSDSVLIIHNDAAVIGDIKCHKLHIEAYATVTGNIIAHQLHIDGEVVGDVYADTLTVGVMSKTAIQGDVNSFNLISNGAIQGEVYALHSLKLLEQATTEGGDVYYQHLEMDVGAEVNGRLIKYTDMDTLSQREQSLQQQLALEKVHTADSATHYFATDYMFDSTSTQHALHFMGSDTASLTIKKGNTIVGDIDCYALHIEQGATVTGTITCRRLHNEGAIVGDTYAHSVWLGSPNKTATSVVATHKGEVKCYQLNLNGVIEGDVYVVQKSVLLAQAEITGALYYNALEKKADVKIGELFRIDGTEQQRQLQQELEENIPEIPENSTHKNTPKNIHNDSDDNNDEGGFGLGLWLLVIGATVFFLILFSIM